MAHHKIAYTRNLLIDIFKTHRHLLSQTDIEYFTRTFKNQHHPTKIRPVISFINSFMSAFNIHGFKMKKYYSCSHHTIILDEIKQLHYKLFMAYSTCAVQTYLQYSPEIFSWKY
jgi:hypothetical protein